MTVHWEEFERGHLTKEEAKELFVKTDPSIEAQIRKAYDSCAGIMGSYDYTLGWIKALRSAGYKLYCITNFTPAGYEECYDAISFIEQFDGTVFSFKEGVLKPEREIYELLLNRYSLKAEECVFIDDTEKNVVGARAVGLHGIVFRGYDEAVAELKKLGVEC